MVCCKQWQSSIILCDWSLLPQQGPAGPQGVAAGVEESRRVGAHHEESVRIIRNDSVETKRATTTESSVRQPNSHSFPGRGSAKKSLYEEEGLFSGLQAQGLELGRILVQDITQGIYKRL